MAESMINNTHWEKTVFYSIQHKNDCLPASDLFHMFTQSIKLYTFYYYVLKSTVNQYAIFQEYSLSVPSALQCSGNPGNI